MTRRVTSPSAPNYALRHRRFGWTALLLWLLFGTWLETMHGFKVSTYLLDELRREFWSLAHFHGATLALVNLIYAPWAEQVRPEWQKWASWSLLAGSLLMPVGFFLGGLVHYEGDPGLGIFLSPPGAFLVLVTVGLQMWSAWQDA